MSAQHKTGLCALRIICIFLMVIAGGCENKTESEPVETPAIASPAEAGATRLSPLAVQRPGGSDATAGWSLHIQQHDQGWIGAEQAITIRFAHPVVPETQLNRDKERLLRLSPSVEFSAQFTATDTLTIVPSQRLQSGQVYSVMISPQGLEGVSASLAPFAFQVQVLRQDYELKISGLVPDQDRGQMKLEGSIG